jgi:peptidoglycan-associated lipoprotein
MTPFSGKISLIPMAFLVGASSLSLGCAHVKQDQFDLSMAEMRAEMRDGDAQVGTRVGELEDRAAQIEDRTAQIEGRLIELSDELTGMEERFQVEIERLEDAIRFNVPVHFGFDASDVREEDQGVLNRFQGIVQGYYPGATITVEGFTDSAGSAAYNLKLGQARAESVRAHLVETGLQGEQVRAVSYGEAAERLIRPEAMGPGAPGEENRRVVLVIDHGGAPPRIISQR